MPSLAPTCAHDGMALPAWNARVPDTFAGTAGKYAMNIKSSPRCIRDRADFSNYNDNVPNVTFEV